jgi:hypothetical protein
MYKNGVFSLGVKNFLLRPRGIFESHHLHEHFLRSFQVKEKRIELKTNLYIFVSHLDFSIQKSSTLSPLSVFMQIV